MLVYVCTRYRMLDVIPHVVTKEAVSTEDELRKKEVNLESECPSPGPARKLDCRGLYFTSATGLE